MSRTRHHRDRRVREYDDMYPAFEERAAKFSEGRSRHDPAAPRVVPGAFGRTRDHDELRPDFGAIIEPARKDAPRFKTVTITLMGKVHMGDYSTVGADWARELLDRLNECPYGKKRKRKYS